MKTKMLLLFILLGTSVYSQVPNSFSYQAVLRNNSGQILGDADVVLRISLFSELETYYVETHTLTTNAYGVVNISIGGGELVTGNFSSVPWGLSPISIKTEVDYQSSGFQEMGTSQLQSVPYAHYAKTVGSIDSSPDAGDEEPIFVVKNKDGFIVFAVYQNGIRMYVEETPGKGTRGGFAIGGIGDNIKLGNEYFRVTPDSVRVYLREPAVKGSRGGFAIGGIGDNIKGVGGDYLYLTPENYFIGHQSGENILPEGLYNSTLGYQAGKSLTTGRSNILIGMEAGLNTTTGRWNTVLGFKAGRDNVSGDFNTFLGYYAGWKNTIGGSNVFIGNQSGQANETGSNNVFLGYFSGLNNLASFNTFLGYQAGLSNTTGTYNAFMGYNAGQANVSGNNNVYIGNEAGYLNEAGFSNVFVGDGAGRQGTSSAWNVFVGYQSGYNTTDAGSHNVFLGHHSGFSNTLGWSNNFIGQGAGYSNTTGTNNIFIGNDAGYSNLESSGNIFMGRNAGYNSTEYGNTIIGHTAGQYLAVGDNNTFLGSLAGHLRTGGDGNTIIGSYANHGGGSGNFNTIIGQGAGYNATGTGNILIGYGAGSNEEGSNKLYISNSSSSSPLIYGDFNSNELVFNANTTSVDISVSNDKPGITGEHNVTQNWGIGVYGKGGFIGVKGESTLEGGVGDRYGVYGIASGGANNWAGYFVGNVYTTGTYNPSDKNLKKQIAPLSGSLAKILNLQGVSYEWKSNEELSAFNSMGKGSVALNFPKGKQIGVIAQDIEKILPEAVLTNSEGIKSVDYVKIIPLLIEAIKEQQIKISSIESELEKVKGENIELKNQKAEMMMLQSRITEIENLLKK